jgi:hypothetical protein
MSQVVDSLAPKDGRSKKRQADSQGLVQVADSLAPEVRQSSQHAFGVVDGPAFETRRSAATERPPNSYEGGIIEEFKDLDNLG